MWSRSTFICDGAVLPLRKTIHFVFYNRFATVVISVTYISLSVQLDKGDYLVVKPFIA